MKVLHLLKTSVGASWAYRQIRQLVALGMEVHVALPPGGKHVEAYQALGVQTHLLQPDILLRRPWAIPRQLARLRAIVDAVQPDLVHSHFVGTTFTMRLALRGRHALPRVFQVPGPLHLEHPVTRRAEMMLADADDYWIPNCEWSLRCYREAGFSAERLFLGHYGKEFDQFVAGAPGKLRAELGADAATRIVGMVALMYPPKRLIGQTRGIKGHEDLIDAMAICLQADPSLLLVLVGGGWGATTAYEQRVRAYGRRKCGDRVVFLGTRADVMDLYPDFTVAVHPSHSENHGGAVESLLLGIPTVTTNVGGFPDIIINGDTGLAVPPRDPRALAAAIQQMLDHPADARAMAERGRLLVSEISNIVTNSRNVYNAYQQILERHPSRPIIAKEHP
jgi:glycosyltransferase involved in cell wall biosynthesis